MTPPRRLQSQTERDAEGFAEKKRREAARAEAPEEVDEDCTGKYERGEIDADELAEKRAERSHEDRFKKLETKQDQTATSLIRLETKVDTVVDLLKGKASEEAKTERTKITTNGKVMIAIVTAAIAAIVTVLTLVLK